MLKKVIETVKGLVAKAVNDSSSSVVTSEHKLSVFSLGFHGARQVFSNTTDQDFVCTYIS
jgi:hypothetical protein